MELRTKIVLLDIIKDAVLIHLEDPSQISAKRLEHIVVTHHIELRSKLVAESVVTNRKIVT